MVTAIVVSVRLKAVTDDPAAANLAGGRQFLNCTLKAVERARRAIFGDGKRLVVVVAACIAFRHLLFPNHARLAVASARALFRKR